MQSVISPNMLRVSVLQVKINHRLWAASSEDEIFKSFFQAVFYAYNTILIKIFGVKVVFIKIENNSLNDDGN